ncbi:MAG: metal-sulfur cluster assembly factor [Actinomycetota bacterium]|jgi:metal-sulfur cluster biosynthetic enzyme|nr:metal-sulfur cluster assembly factor [Euzebyaceae bacterium]MBA3620168.1 metal-sulfur cluster assembly factor [Acidothermales bacterium]MDQ3452635.1 metal-sulfur cluster assembly factor [Actinomycetota bacterium]
MSDTTQTTDRGSWPEGEESDEAFAAKQDFADVALDADGMPAEDEIRIALKAVMDPEIGINIVDLGLVYGIDKADSKVTVTMTLTSMGCPLTELIHQQCSLVLARLPGVDDVDVDFTFSPPWSTDMISDEASDELRAMGFNV